MKENEIEVQLKQLADTTILARENFNIWWVYKYDRPQYVSVLNQYLGFFSNSIHAHFLALLMAITKLTEKKSNKSLSLFSLIQFASEKSLLDERVLSESRELLNSQSLVISKLLILRNNHFAHLNKNVDSDKVFKKAGITPDDINELIKIAEKIINDLHYSYNRSIFSSFDTGAKNDILTILNKISKIENNGRSFTKV